MDTLEEAYKYIKKGSGILSKITGGVTSAGQSLYHMQPNNITNYKNIIPSIKGEYFKISPNGTPYLGWCSFTVYDTTNFPDIELTDFGKKWFSPELQSTFTLHNITYQISGQNTIVESFVKGKNGSNKEYISQTDKVFTISGIISGFDIFEFEIPDVIVARQMLDVIKNSRFIIEISNYYLNIQNDIRSGVLMSYNIQPSNDNSGQLNVQLVFKEDTDFQVF